MGLDPQAVYRRATLSLLDSLIRTSDRNETRIEALEERERELTDDVAELGRRIVSLERVLASRTRPLA